MGVDPLSRLAYAAQAGDERALADLVEAAYEPIWRLCAALTDIRSADDLAQEAVLRAVRSLQHFRGESTARAWLLAVARYTCIDEIRARSRRRQHYVPLVPAIAQKPTGSDASDHIIVTDLLQRLHPDRRAAFTLTQIIGLTYQEAAHVCDCPPGTIRSRVARARSDLLAMINNSEEQDPRCENESDRSNTA